jgi:hypothetical protein
MRVIYFFSQNPQEELFMTLYDELYFEINASGAKSEVKKFVNYLKSGELDDFFEFSADYINYGDDYAEASADKEVSVVISNDDFGIEIEEFDTDEFLEIICKAGKGLYLKGQLFDVDDEEYSFISEAGDAYYINAEVPSSTTVVTYY